MDTQPAPKPASKLFTEYYGSVFFLMILAFLVVALVVLKPKLDEVKAVNAEIASTLQVLDGERNYLNSLDQSISAAQNIAPVVLDQVDRALPREQGIPELLVLFGNTADRDGVKIANVTFADGSGTPGARAATSSVSELAVNMTVTAENYPQIKKFIRDLEVSLRLLDIIGINVSTQGRGSAYALQMKTYVYTPPVKAMPTPVQR